MFIKHKIEYIKNDEKHSVLNISHTNKKEELQKVIKDEDILEATIQEYPLKKNSKKPIKKGGRVVYEEAVRQHMVSFSGGKDSTAMLIRMLELGMKIDKIVFADTKYEFEEMYEYVDKIERYIQNRFDKDLKIERVRTDSEVYEWIFGEITRGKRKGEMRGFPLTIFPCHWSRESKIKPLNEIMQGHHRYIGIAVDEKHRKSKYAEDMLLHYPLIEWGWTEQDCVDYLEDLGIMNPLYTEEITRTGCWWCPKQSVGAWRSLYINHPEKWAELKKAEEKVGRPVRVDKGMDEMELDFDAEIEQLKEESY